MKSPVHPQLALKSELTTLGLCPGSSVMVHASLRAIGPMERGADGLLDSIQEVISPGGTLLMVLGADADEPFDALQTQVDVEEMGVLAEVFRKRAGTAVSDHAASRYAAIGSLASHLLSPTPLHDYHGPGSSLERLVEANGYVLRLGADQDTLTLTHYAEYLARLPNKVRVRREYRRADIGAQWIESLDDSDGIAVWNNGDYFPQVLADYLAAGRAKMGPVGNARAELFRARDFVDFGVAWLERNLAPQSDT